MNGNARALNAANKIEKMVQMRWISLLFLIVSRLFGEENADFTFSKDEERVGS